MATLKEKLLRIANRYKRVTEYRFFHISDADLKRSRQEISVWFFLHAPDYGYSVMEITFRRSQVRTPKEWSGWISDTLLEEIMGSILDNIEVRHARRYRLVDVIGFGWYPALRRGKKHAGRGASYTAVSRRRHKATKKRI